ncbi:MAG: phenylalanine--tRNA ligase subunit beta [Lachnospiraceae bacterium]|nr:phenylalanine--tRNA ligase subunit beta [Lachnospiraceae bacterium]
MVASYKWVKSYVPGLDADAEEFRNAMTLSGSKVEGYEKLDADLDKIVIGQIKTIEKHPDADKLVVCQVDIGEETVQIVTAATNVFEGAKLPVVLAGGRVAGSHDGAKVPGGIKIKDGKLRGVESHGMMCSIEELGSTTDYYPAAAEDGIYILPEDAPVGESAITYLGRDDVVFEFEITSNRVDCYSVLGIAREAAATFGKEFCMPQVKEAGDSRDVDQYIKVTVKDEDLCPRFTARVVKNVTIAPSPAWMQHRLASHGIRPINNIVDITNYVMEEFGQPMHAYDMDTIAGNEIVVRRAQEGETFVTLDGQERKLDDTMLMICDGEKPIGLAGIMGGENSMITDDVHTMLFEAACFDGTNVRLSSKKVGLRTDASSKFEKGLDPNLAIQAINRACELVEELGCGEVVDGVVDVHTPLPGGHEIPFDPDGINGLLGIDISEDEMIEYLHRVELEVDKDRHLVIAPSWRQDMLREADVAEEVARFYGYDKIPMTLPSGEATAGKLSYRRSVERLVREAAEIAGFSEAMTYSFESPKVFDKLLLPADSPLREAITIANPLGEDYSIMRTISLNGMLTSLATNYSHRNKEVRLFEAANIYIPKALPLTELPDERMQITFGMYGCGDFFDMKGVLEDVFTRCGVKSRRIYDPSEKKPFFHPGRQADVFVGKEKVAYIGEVHPLVAQDYGIKTRAYIAVIDLPALMPFVTFDKKYVGLAKFPAVNRDLSMVVPKDVSAGQIETIFLQRGGKILESVELFDIYEGEQIGEGFKSMAYKLVFRASDRTLEENDITAALKKIMNGLEGLGIELRS